MCLICPVSTPKYSLPLTNPSALSILCTLCSPSTLMRWCMSLLLSPQGPTHRPHGFPYDWSLVTRGPFSPDLVPRNRVSFLDKFSWYNFAIAKPAALLSTPLPSWTFGNHVFPAPQILSSTRENDGPSGVGSWIRKSGTRPWRARPHCRSPPSVYATARRRSENRPCTSEGPRRQAL